MSRYTSKSDFGDWCEMHNNPSQIVELANVYMGDAKVEIKNEKDLIPYYTHLIASMACSPESQNIHLSRESFIDIDEKEFMAWKIITAIKVARKAKKERKPFTYEYLKESKELRYDTTDQLIWKKLVSIVNGYPNILKEHISKDFRESLDYVSNWLYPKYFFDVHDIMHNRMRESFVEFAKENGFSVIKKNATSFERTEGIYHPVINKMCLSIMDFHKMEADWG